MNAPCLFVSRERYDDLYRHIRHSEPIPGTTSRLMTRDGIAVFWLCSLIGDEAKLTDVAPDNPDEKGVKDELR